VSCAKTAEPMQMQFGMLSWVNMYYMGCRCRCPQECLANWKALQSMGFWGLGERL